VLDPGQTRGERARVVLAELRLLLEREGDRVCAIVIEPMVQAAGGMLTHDTSFVRGVRALADEFGCLLVADEVATGVGRTGRMWAVEHAGITPDLLTCGKGLTGGYLPLSAVMATEAVYEAFLGSPESGRTFFHGHSFTANPLCCAAAIANLHLMRERETVVHAERVGELLGDWTADLAAADAVLEVRRIGTMTGIEVRSVGDRTGFAVCQEARRNGVWVRPLGDVVVLMPPLAIGDDDLRLLVDTVAGAIVDVVR
jgi:adenosylmethionine-8-amino-7-oxononanoate aminotransferase